MRIRPTLALALTVMLAALLAPACGGSSGAGDARCVALCTIKEPSTPDAGDICSQASADACLDQCGARVDGTTAPCGDCLLEDASFSTGTVSIGGGGCDISINCPDGECTMDGPAGSCKYCAGDSGQQQDCFKQTNPRREVACKTDFRDPTKCSALCAAK